MKLKSDKEMKDQFVIEVKNRFDGLVEQKNCLKKRIV